MKTIICIVLTIVTIVCMTYFSFAMSQETETPLTSEVIAKKSEETEETEVEEEQKNEDEQQIEEKKKEKIVVQLKIDWDKLFNGEVIVEAVKNQDDLPGVRAIFTVSAPRERIWATLTDYENLRKIFEGIEKIVVLEQNEDGAQVEFWIDAILKKYHYILYRHYEEPGRRLTWKRISGDMKRIEGFWQIHDTPKSGVYLLVYESYVKVGEVIPTSLVRWGAMRRASKMGKCLRKWIEKMS